jgi:hypothetical protein
MNLDIKVALVCIARMEDYYLDEWLEYNHKLGFDKIILYQNDWRTDIEKPYLQKEIADGRSIQVDVYNKFLMNNKEYDWVAFFDCDEFLVLKKHNNVKEFINEYKDRTDVIGVNWIIHGNMGVKNRYCNSLLKMFPRRAEKPDGHVKVFVKGMTNERMQLPHNTFGLAMDTDGRKFGGYNNYNGPLDVAYLSHIHNKTREDWMLRVQRGRIDCNIQHDPNRWDNEVGQNEDVEDLSAFNFLYGD